VSEIGSTLGRAREERGLELADVAAATRIRRGYLAALEEERFEELPVGYVQAFLRTYAMYLGLDAQRLVDEYGSRFPPRRPIPARPPPHGRRDWAPSRGLLLILAGGVGLLALLVAGEIGSRKGPPELPKPTSQPARPVVASSAQRVRHPVRVERRRRIVLRASGGDCWIAVRLGSAGGPLLYENVLRPGQAVSFVRSPLWVRIGAPAHLVLVLDGRRLAPLSGYRPLNVVVSASGARSV
jgi:transcriptional regulator with XRE-family HTH domain